MVGGDKVGHYHLLVNYIVMKFTVEQQKEVDAILSNFHVPQEDRPKTEGGDLDITALNQLPYVKDTVKKLNEVGVRNQSDLFFMGYTVAGMVLKF